MTQEKQSKKLAQVVGWSAFQSAFKVLANFAMGKFVAHLAGPSGIAILGQFINLTTLAQTSTGGSLQNGLIQGLSVEDQNSDGEATVFNTGLSISILLTVIVSIVWIFAYPMLRTHLIPEDFPSWVYYSFPVSLFFSSGIFLVVSYYSAKRNYKLNAFTNIIQNVFILVLFLTLGKIGGLYGACAGLFLGQIPSFLLIWRFFRKDFRSKISFAMPGKDAGGLWNFSLLAIYSAFATQIMMILIRTLFFNGNQVEEGGLWESLQRISNLWVPVISVVFTSHLLPKLSESSTKKSFLNQTAYSLAISGGLIIAFSIGVFLTKSWLIELLFSKDFNKVSDVIGVHLLGDILKAMTWTLAYALLSRKKAIALIALDLGFNILYYFLAQWFFNEQGLGGVVYAYPLAMLINFVATAAVWLQTLMQEPETTIE